MYFAGLFNMTMKSEKVAKSEKLVKANGNPKVYFDIAVGGEPAGRIVMEVTI